MRTRLRKGPRSSCRRLAGHEVCRGEARGAVGGNQHARQVGLLLLAARVRPQALDAPQSVGKLQVSHDAAGQHVSADAGGGGGEGVVEEDALDADLAIAGELRHETAAAGRHEAAGADPAALVVRHNLLQHAHFQQMALRRGRYAVATDLVARIRLSGG